MTGTWRFHGWIAGAGTSGGTRLVLGHWPHSPFGAFSDVMVAHPDGSRELLAPTAQIADFVAATYHFDEVRLCDVDVAISPDAPWRRFRAGGSHWQVQAGPLAWEFTVGHRHPLGFALALLPGPAAQAAPVARAISPVAARILPGVRTYGRTQVPDAAERLEWYAGRDLHVLSWSTAHWDGADLGALAPVTPPPRFGFSGTPRTPGLTRVVSTVREP